jgi:hypothetical protein
MRSTDRPNLRIHIPRTVVDTVSNSYGSEGWGFESLRARRLKPPVNRGFVVYWGIVDGPVGRVMLSCVPEVCPWVVVGLRGMSRAAASAASRATSGRTLV